MTDKIYYLSTCDTCKRIMGQINDISAFELVDIKDSPVTKEQLEEIKTLSGLEGSDLFNKRARKYKDVKRDDMTVSEYEHLITEEYTFLKRPVIIYGQKAYVGNSKKTIEAAVEAINA